MRVEIWNDGARWDAFVESHPEACNYHRWIWRAAVQETFGHKPYYLGSISDGALHGVLPLFSVSSLLFGRFLVSVPFFSYGGVLVKSDRAREALVSYSIELAREIGAQYVELRQRSVQNESLHNIAAKVVMTVPLPGTADELRVRLPSRLRNKIRYARKNGITAEWNSAQRIDLFYQVFARNMRNLGTPVYPRIWFEKLCRTSSSIQILTLRDSGQVVASAFLVPFRDTLEMPWCASLPESRKKYSHELLYWTLLEWAIENGFKKVDLGRCTPGSGIYQFKHHWRCDEQPLYWSYWLRPGRAIPQLRPENKKFHLAIELWKRLPLVLANKLGPLIARSLP